MDKTAELSVMEYMKADLANISSVDMKFEKLIQIIANQISLLDIVIHHLPEENKAKLMQEIGMKKPATN